MLSIQIVCVGKLKETYWRAACEEYAKRLSVFCRFQVIEVDEQRLPERPSSAQIAAALETEGTRILDKIPGGSCIIPLCIEGKGQTSEQLAQFLEHVAVMGGSSISFVIGSSWGLSPAVKQAGRLRLSMSAMTFPHQLARVMLCEQIYRAFQINSGGKYHK